MKKTTKILLVLAAVVAMTIGAVSTVMAADVVIGTWIPVDESKNVYKATDTEGNEIIRGWAKSEANRWYYFDSGYMVKDAFVTDKGETYYFDSEGTMASGKWVEFKNDKMVTLDGDLCSNVTAAFRPRTVGYAFTDVFGNNSKYKTLWCYFAPNGAMAYDEWVKTDNGLWYYICGAYCVLDDYTVNVDLNQDGDVNDANEGIYGFGPDGHMFSGWTPYVVTTNASNGNVTNAGTPYENVTGASAGTSTTYWTYYKPNGQKVDEGWEKIGDEWCFFIDDEKLGYKAVQKAIVEVDNYTFYIDADGYMLKQARNFAAKETIDVYKMARTEGNLYVESIDEIKVPEDSTLSLRFDSTSGVLKTGKEGNFYYYAGAAVYDADVDNIDVVTGGAIQFAKDITVDADNNPVYMKGERLSGNFFVIKDGKAYYYETGVLLKNTSVTFKSVTITLDADGAVKKVTGDNTVDVTIGGVKVNGVYIKR